MKEICNARNVADFFSFPPPRSFGAHLVLRELAKNEIFVSHESTLVGGKGQVKVRLMPVASQSRGRERSTRTRSIQRGGAIIGIDRLS